MKHIKLFEQFLNEGKDWYDYKPEKIAKAFIKDGEPGEGPKVTSDQLNDWLYGFAQDKRIKDGMPVGVLEDVIDILNKKGYKLNVDDVVKEAPSSYEDYR